MFQRFQDRSPHESEMIESAKDENRDDAPYSLVDSRTNFTSHLTSQHSYTAPYPSSPVVSATTTMFSKYLTLSPPEAHRYMQESFHPSFELPERNRFIIDSDGQIPGITHRLTSELHRPRTSCDTVVDSYHHPDEDAYHNSNSIDLQRESDSSPEQIVNAERLVSQLQRFHSNSLDAHNSSIDHLEKDESVNEIQSPNKIVLHYQNDLSDSIRPLSEPPLMLRTHTDPQRLVQESFREYFAISPKHSVEPDITVSPNLRESPEYIRYSDSIRSDIFRYSGLITGQRHIGIDDLHMNSDDHQTHLPGSIKNINPSLNVIPESCTVETALSHDVTTGVLPSSSMFGVGGLTSHENLRIGESPHSMLRENLRFKAGSNALSHEKLRPVSDMRIRSEVQAILSHDQILEARVQLNTVDEEIKGCGSFPLSAVEDTESIGVKMRLSMIRDNLRMGGENPCSLIAEISDSAAKKCTATSDTVKMVPENLCLSELQQEFPKSEDGISNRAVAFHGKLDHTLSSHYEHSTQRITNDNSKVLTGIQSPHYSESLYHDELNMGPSPSLTQLPDTPSTSVPLYYSSSFSNSGTNHYVNSYLNDERDGYHDIKPFDQNYPVSMPLMFASQDNVLPTAAVSKQPKPKKTKDPKPPRLPIVHKCNECNRLFKNSTQLKNHMWRHTGEKPFSCEECGSKFTQQGNLRAHKRIHTGERPYQCSDCQACFTQLSTLKTHQKIHSDERPYKCNDCDAAFRQVANLKTHQVTHTGERPHKCELCDKAFTQKSNLKAHKNRVHTGDGLMLPSKRGRKKNPLAIKPFTCLECGAKFTMINNLKIHSKLHSGDKPYECDYCGAGFSQRSNLKTHVQRMHIRCLGVGKRHIKCDECPAMFRLRRCLKTHKKRRHPIKSLKIRILRESHYLSDSEDEEDDTDTDSETGESVDDGEYEMGSVIYQNMRECRNMEVDLARKLHCSEKKCPPIREPLVSLEEPKVEPRDAPLLPEVERVGCCRDVKRIKEEQTESTELLQSPTD